MTPVRIPRGNERRAPVDRKSKETQVEGIINIDGTGETDIKTPVGFLNHMIELFAFHGRFDLQVEVKGDTHIDIHHTNEDIGLALGKAIKNALGENYLGINRFGSAFAPMESTLGHCVVDLCGRYSLVLLLNGKTTGDLPPISNQHEYTFVYLQHFLESFAKQLGATLIINVTSFSGSAEMHEVAETVFKSLGLALDQATTIDPRRSGQVPSTKGIID